MAEEAPPRLLDAESRYGAAEIGAQGPQERPERPPRTKRWALLLAAGLVAAATLATVLPACFAGGRRCRPRLQGPPRRAPTGGARGGPAAAARPEPALRLITAMRGDALLDALDALPPQIRRFAKNERLRSSALQLMHLASEEILAEAQRILGEHPDVVLVLRDFKMSLDTGQDGRSDGPIGLALQPKEPPTPPPLPPLPSNQRWRPVADAPGTPSAPAAADAAAPPAPADSGGGGSGGGARRRPLQLLAPLAPGGPPLPPHLAAAGVPEAWRVTRGQREVVVAVLDTGADVAHPALAGGLWRNPKEIPGNGIDDDGNGYVDDVHGFAFEGACNGEFDIFGECLECGPTADVGDTEGHGTHVAGIIAAARDAAQGVAGVAPAVKVMVLKVSDCSSGAIYASAVFRALDYALRMGAHLASCSFGRAYPQRFAASHYAPPWEDHSAQRAAYRRALEPLRAAGVLVLAAAGNNAVDLDALSALGYSNSPCLLGLEQDNVLCVGGAGASGALAPYSNYGAKAVALAAPGTVTSTWPGGGAKEVWGTSMATPVVTGAAALALSVISDLTGSLSTTNVASGGRAAPLLRALLLEAAAPRAAATYADSGKRVDAGAAVRAALSRFAPRGMPAAAAALPAAAAARAPLSHAGFVERYYRNGTKGGWQGGVPVETSVRPAQLPLGGFKYGRGYTVRLSASLLLETPGIHTLMVSAPAAQASINGLPAPPRPGPAPPGGGAAYPFLVPPGPAGWHAVDIAVPDPSAPIDLQLRTPESGRFARAAGWRSFAPPPPPAGNTRGAGAAAAAGGPLPPAPGFVPTRAATWTVYWNLTANPPAARDVNKAAAASAAANGGGGGLLPGYQSAAPAAALSFAKPGALSAFLAPPSAPLPAPGGGAVGSVVGGVEVPGAGKSYAFKVTCPGCTLTVAGQLLVDAWQRGPTPAPLVSGCTTFAAAGVYPVRLDFSAPNLPTAVLSLEWAACGDGESGGGGGGGGDRVTGKWGPVAAAGEAGAGAARV